MSSYNFSFVSENAAESQSTSSTFSFGTAETNSFSSTSSGSFTFESGSSTAAPAPSAAPFSTPAAFPVDSSFKFSRHGKARSKDKFNFALETKETPASFQFDAPTASAYFDSRAFATPETATTTEMAFFDIAVAFNPSDKLPEFATTDSETAPATPFPAQNPDVLAEPAAVDWSAHFPFTGTTVVHFAESKGEEDDSLQCITAMGEYKCKSLEELRSEDEQRVTSMFSTWKDINWEINQQLLEAGIAGQVRRLKAMLSWLREPHHPSVTITVDTLRGVAQRNKDIHRTYDILQPLLDANADVRGDCVKGTPQHHMLTRYAIEDDPDALAGLLQQLQQLPSAQWPESASHLLTALHAAHSPRCQRLLVEAKASVTSTDPDTGKSFARSLYSQLVKTSFLYGNLDPSHVPVAINEMDSLPYSVLREADTLMNKLGGHKPTRPEIIAHCCSVLVGAKANPLQSPGHIVRFLLACACDAGDEDLVRAYLGDHCLPPALINERVPWPHRHSPTGSSNIAPFDPIEYASPVLLIAMRSYAPEPAKSRIVDLLIAANANLDEKDTVGTSSRLYQLIDACAKCDLSRVQRWLADNAEHTSTLINSLACFQSDLRLYSPFTHAVRYFDAFVSDAMSKAKQHEQEQVIRLLASAKAALNLADQPPYTTNAGVVLFSPVMSNAVVAGRVGIVKLLLELRCDPDLGYSSDRSHSVLESAQDVMDGFQNTADPAGCLACLRLVTAEAEAFVRNVVSEFICEAWPTALVTDYLCVSDMDAVAASIVVQDYSPQDLPWLKQRPTTMADRLLEAVGGAEAQTFDCDFRVLRRCIAQGADINQLLTFGKQYRAPLLIAVRLKAASDCSAWMQGRCRLCIKYLMEAKADPLVKDSNGADARHFELLQTVMFEQPQNVREMVARFRSADPSFDINALLHFLQPTTTVAKENDHDYSRPVLLAAYQYSKSAGRDIPQLLMELKANPMARDTWGCCAADYQLVVDILRESKVPSYLHPGLNLNAKRWLLWINEDNKNKKPKQKAQRRADDDDKDNEQNTRPVAVTPIRAAALNLCTAVAEKKQDATRIRNILQLMRGLIDAKADPEDAVERIHTGCATALEMESSSRAFDFFVDLPLFDPNRASNIKTAFDGKCDRLPLVQACRFTSTPHSVSIIKRLLNRKASLMCEENDVSGFLALTWFDARTEGHPFAALLAEFKKQLNELLLAVLTPDPVNIVLSYTLRTTASRLTSTQPELAPDREIGYASHPNDDQQGRTRTYMPPPPIAQPLHVHAPLALPAAAPGPAAGGRVVVKPTRKRTGNA